MSQSLASFYRGKRVLITGHTGFTGGWLVAWLKLLGASVCGYGLPPGSRPNFFDVTLLDRGISSLFADLRDRETLANIFADFQPEIVFHAAAQNHLSGAQADAIDLFETNVVGTLNLLEEARLTACTRAIVLLSDFQGRDSTAQPDWLSSTRTLARESAVAFAESFFRGTRTGIGIARFPVLIGGGDWSESRLAGKLVHGLISGEAITVRSAAFSCLHVLEAAGACLHLAEELFASGSSASSNLDFLASSNPTSEVQFANRFATHWGGDVQIETEPGDAATPGGLPALTPMQQYPGWKPALSLDEAIAWAVDWYKAYFDDSALAWHTTEGQIAKYSALSSPHPATTVTIRN